MAAVAAGSATLLLAACGEEASSAAGGDWKPTKPIEYIAPANTGGGWDTLARSSARVLDEANLLDRPMRVVNKPGAGGAIGWSYIAKHQKDPHKLFVTSPPILLVPLAGASDQTYRDFTPIARLNSEPLAYVVKASSPFKTFAELAKKLKSDPRKVSVAGGSGPGSLDHVGLAGAVQAAGADASKVTYVPFDGGGEALTSLLGGHADVAVAGASEVRGLVRSGDVRVLAVSSGQRSPILPDTPTLTESGIDYVFDIWRGVMAPKGLTEGQVAYYEKAFAEMVKQDSWKKESKKLGWTDDYLGSKEFGKFLDEQNKEFSGILTDVGLKK
ncbi:Bug family tripartite tricarboxylate transporter substrate binding protein [Streptomyces gobiensis]|uniref:Bug family tripartite tricarboxylate transporter substrate binding protein n=1 Tax=Streptomyces gobiensis TaxID=2875706 RepID=UPI001E41B26D|nr:tripartite tricarboxylate transporter substrate binding protein [Streptomyces gobiensis]UGY94627.1 tripartite tricarboxylate transporter substrate binding protein [Streptomyces gobiensis]